MCRLIAYVGEPLSPAHLVFGGRHPLYEQSWASRELFTGTLNADGYAVVWYARGKPARIAEARPIWYDQELAGALAGLESRCILAAVHDRATGSPTDRSALAPMTYDRWAFVLNGFVPSFRSAHMRALRGALPDELYAELRGSSDVETLFLLVVSELLQGRTMVGALESVASMVKKYVGKAEAQLNMVLSDGERIAAIRCSTVLMTNSLYVAKRPPFAPDGVVLASEAPDPGAVWEAVDGHSSLEIEPDGTTKSEMVFL